MATKISGIEKLDEKTIQIRTSGYDPNFVYQLILPICPLHYYGDETMYDYERDQFGFTKGDLEEIKKKK